MRVKLWAVLSVFSLSVIVARGNEEPSGMKCAADGDNFTEISVQGSVSLHRSFFGDFKTVHRFEAQRYAVSKMLGKGKQGVVVQGLDLWTGERVAIKKIDLFSSEGSTLSAVREMKLMRLFNYSDDLVRMKHVLLPASPRQLRSVYLVMELLAFNGKHVRPDYPRGRASTCGV